ncbi:MAG TPA: hypothetical protein ENI95_01455 [Chloroflexi bacterium]|nr:hypothetical protein [Chloroflexota bacterium]
MPGGIGTGAAARPRPTTQTLGKATTKKKKKTAKKPAAPEPFLSLDTKLDILGIGLILVALITVLSFLSRSPGALTRAWLRFLFQMFGWGAYLVPVGIGAIGVWLIWRHFGDQLPPVDPIRIAGIVLGFVGLLTLVHATVAATHPYGPVVYVNPRLADPASPGYYPERIWEEAIACPVKPQELIEQGWVRQTAYLSSYDIARCGQGGGFVGAFIQVTLYNLLGGAAVFVIALVAVFAGSLMATRMTIKDVVQLGARGYERLRDRRSAAKATAYKRTRDGRMVPLEEEEEAEEEGKKGKKGRKPRGKKEAEKEKATPPPLPGRPSIVTGRRPGDSTGATPAPATAAPAATAAASGRPGARPSSPGKLTVPPRPGQSAGAGERGQTGKPTTSPPPRPTTPSGRPAGSRPGSPGKPPGAGERPSSPTGGPTSRAAGPRAPGAPPTGGTRPATSPDRTAGSPAEGRGPATGTPRSGAPPRPGSPPRQGSAPPKRDEGEEDEKPEPGAPPGGATSGPPGQAAPPRPASKPGRRNRPGRTFGPPPPATIGGQSRPAPKPSTSTGPAEATGEEKDEDIVFDDMASGEPDILKNAIDLDREESPPADRDAEQNRAEGKVPPAKAAGDGEARGEAPPARREGKASGPQAGVKGQTTARPGGAPPRPTAPPKPAAKPPAARPAASPAPAATPPRVSSPEPEKKEPEWVLPRMEDILEVTVEKTISDKELRERAAIIEQTLSSFGAPGRVVEVNHGPVITQFGVEPDYVDGRAGKRIKVKVGKISALADDLALALAAPSIRIEAPVPGKGYVGIEVPNAEPSIVGLRDVMDTPEFRNLNAPLKLALGQDVSGNPVVADLTAMPHLLIAGTTGSGKSVCINGIICTMLMTCRPDELKMIMVDPKRVELTNYNGIPHLMSPVVTELERIVGVLKWVQREMDERYRHFALAGARNISDYNGRVERGMIPDGEKMPYIMVIVDELADLMMLAPDETERVITRLAQMARATGIHIIISTQRPSVDVVTGLIKANFPARIAFAVATGVDSRVILDMPGAEKLLGRGDMLFQAPDAPLPIRMQGVFVSDREIQKIVEHWREQNKNAPPATMLSLSASSHTFTSAAVRATQKPLFETDEEGADALFDEAVELVRDMGKASISLLQRHLRIGYTRAARLIDLMEERGVIGPHEGGSKPRVVFGPDGEPLGSDLDSEEDDSS